MSMICLVTSLVSAQGLIFFNNGPSVANRISTNSVPGGPATGYTGSTPSIYYYVLYASPVNASINGSTNAVSGLSPNYVFDNPAGWMLVGMGQNMAAPGRMVPTSQGTSSASQGPPNPDGSLTVQGIAGGQYAYFVVLGWSTPDVGTNVESLAAAYHSGYAGWIGQSAVSGAIQLGDRGVITTPDVFSALGPPSIQGFLLGAAGLFDGLFIYSQPTNMAISVGNQATLYVGAYGPGTLSYNWYKNSQLISGANSASYEIIHATTNDVGQYYVMVSSSAYPNAPVTSATAEVIVGTPSTINQQPVRQTVTAGTSVSLTVAASGTAPLSYQWYNASGMILGATNNSLAFNPAQTNNWDSYYVIVSNPFGTLASLPATLIVYQPVTIITQPVSQLVTNRGTATFAVAASGYPPPDYQWFLNGTNGIVGGTNSTLQLPHIQPPQAGAYTVAVTNLFGSVTSSAALLQVVDGAPIIMTPPINQVVGIGATAYFSVDAIGSSLLAYQWLYNGTNVLQGATNALLQLNDVQVSQSGTYAVVVTNLFGAVTSTPAFLRVADRMVTNCTESSLRAAMAGGGTVAFACDGTITLANTISISANTVLDGSGHQVTISGGNSIRVFYVNPNIAFTVINLTISNGRTPDGTNGIWNGTSATDGGPGEPGGGFYNAGSLMLRDCLVSSNRTGYGGHGWNSGTYGGPNSIGGAGGAGGGIYNAGTLTLSNCLVSGNSTGIGGGGGGGITYYYLGGTGGFGGGIFNAGTLRLDNSTFGGNTSGNGADNGLRGPGANGGMGGGIWSGGILTANGCTFAGNSTGYGGHGGASDMNGGPGGGGGSGGAICNAGMLMLTNCSFAGNSTGYGGTGGWGQLGQNGATGPNGLGAGIYNQSSLDLVNCTISTNRVGGGVINASNSVRLLNTLLAANIPANCSGVITDAGHNLSSDGSCTFTGAGSMNNVDPKLGSLADNGGPTLTMALLPGSPAIDAGSAVGAPATDQRGVARPQGPGVDIGAFEFQYIPFFSGIAINNATNCQLQMAGLLPNQSFTVQASSNFINWSTVTIFTAGTNGLFQFVDPMPRNWPTRFYRLKTGTP